MSRVLCSMALITALGCSSANTRTPDTTPSGQSTLPASRFSPTSAAAGAMPVTKQIRTCRWGHLSARVTTFGSMMSHPYLDVSVTNHGGSPCRLRGYPELTMTGHLGYDTTGPDQRLSVVVQHGPIYERSDPGDAPVTLHGGEAASFSVGTVAAYPGHIRTITAIRFTLPGVRRPYRVFASLPATSPLGRAIPVGVTALRAARP